MSIDKLFIIIFLRQVFDERFRCASYLLPHQLVGLQSLHIGIAIAAQPDAISRNDPNLSTFQVVAIQERVATKIPKGNWFPQARHKLQNTLA